MLIEYIIARIESVSRGSVDIINQQHKLQWYKVDLERLTSFSFIDLIKSYKGFSVVTGQIGKVQTSEGPLGK